MELKSALTTSSEASLLTKHIAYSITTASYRQRDPAVVAREPELLL
jgi:hypothetical protein